eukprot:9467625-Pyramimonas_sp.AAC.1
MSIVPDHMHERYIEHTWAMQLLLKTPCCRPPPFTLQLKDTRFSMWTSTFLEEGKRSCRFCVGRRPSDEGAGSGGLTRTIHRLASGLVLHLSASFAEFLPESRKVERKVG